MVAVGVAVGVVGVVVAVAVAAVVASPVLLVATLQLAPHLRNTPRCAPAVPAPPMVCTCNRHIMG